VPGSIRDVFIGWVAGDGLRLQFKIVVGALVKPKNQPGGAVMAP